MSYSIFSLKFTACLYEKRIICIQTEKIKSGVYKAIFLPLSKPVTIIVTTGGDTYGEQSIFGSDPYTFAHCNYI